MKKYLTKKTGVLLRGILYIALLFASFSVNVAEAQLVGREAFLKGQYLEVGIAECGSFGTMGAAPTGYHPNMSGNRLGFVADADQNGWDVGTPPHNGEYFLPGSPEEGWGIEINGTNYNNNQVCRDNGIPGSITGYSNTFSAVSATWLGSVEGLSISKRTYFPPNGVYFVTEVTLTNTTGTTLADVYYMRNVDPDNEVMWTGDYTTVNTIVSQPSSTNCTALVSAVGLRYGMYLGLGTKDNRARVTWGGFSNRSASDIYNGASYLSQTGSQTDDEAISLAFFLGSLAPGETTTLSYAYVLSEGDLDIALTATATPTFYANGINITSTGFVTTCGSSEAVTLEVRNAPGYTWTWAPSSDLNTTTGEIVIANPSTSRTYTVTGTPPSTSDGCAGGSIITKTITISRSSLEVSIASLSNVTCKGEKNGAITVSASGSGTLNYSIDKGSTYQAGSTFENLGPGNYTITVTDENGCSGTVSATIAEPAPLSITTTQTNVSTFGGSNGAINLTVSGGTAPYTYNWSNGSTSEDLSELTAGSYTVAVSDANNCESATTTVTITQPTSPACTISLATALTHVSTPGGGNGAIDLSVSGGTAPFTYMWSNGGTTEDLSGLMAGTYTVTVTDANRCTATATVTIIQPTAPVACSNTGSISWEYWNLPARITEVYNFPVDTEPDGRGSLNSFSTPANRGKNYGIRVRGYICPPVSGEYTFYVSADDRAELYLSSDTDPMNKQRIAFTRTATKPGEYDKFPSQMSAKISLQSGQRYYIEARLREFRFKDYLMVAWQMPDGTMESPIAGQHLIPFEQVEETGILWQYVLNLHPSVNLPSGGVIIDGITPSGSRILDAFSTPVNFADRYGAQVRGYVVPPASGMYTFNLAADDQAELWLSTDNTVANRQLIASVTSWTKPLEYNRYPSQMSGEVHLEAGQRYYIEALHVEKWGGDHLSVGWSMAGGMSEAVISGQYLRPYEPGMMMEVEQKATGTELASLKDQANTLVAYPNPFSDKITLEFSLEKKGDVKLDVFNLQGELVKSIENGTAESDRVYQYEFDGSQYASGVYICRLTSNGKVEHKRIVLAK